MNPYDCLVTSPESQGAWSMSGDEPTVQNGESHFGGIEDPFGDDLDQYHNSFTTSGKSSFIHEEEILRESDPSSIEITHEIGLNHLPEQEYVHPPLALQCNTNDQPMQDSKELPGKEPN